MISKNLNQISADIDEDPRIIRKMMAALEVVYGKWRDGNPDRVFTNEEKAQMRDEAKALCGFDTSKKTDPNDVEWTDEEKRQFKEISEMISKWKETRD